ncbi:hydroxyacid dehydrogenase [uncultured Pseudokineococcus sp.]|uniref:hydroxyacid dehydrogenase n=1 Tax=uncultured Pseudokineococcus sp. TaxID=1642928 RepID=UPI0026065C17|nr:hydroxyacid dehydrogenase [uncultured Pseudokineococcus sp.]
MRILLALPEPLPRRFLTPAARERLSAVGEVDVHPTPEDHRSPAAASALARADVLVTGWGTDLLDEEVLAAAPALRAVVHSAGSVRPVVTRGAVGRGLLVSSQARLNALPVAEYALATILLSLKGVLLARSRYREARGPLDVRELLSDHGVHARRVGVVGASVVGRRLLELLRPFDVEVVLADPTLDAEEARELGAELLDLDDLLRTSDVVSLHAPLLPSTRGMLDARRLGLLRDGAALVNTARGALVEEGALVRELVAGRISAVLDVTEPEVPEPTSPLWDLPDVLLTPHVAGALGSELLRLGDGAVEEVERLAAGLPLLRPVTAETYDRLA